MVIDWIWLWQQINEGKMKESKKLDKFLYLTKELKKQKNKNKNKQTMQHEWTVLPIVVRNIGTVPTNLENRLNEMVFMLYTHIINMLIYTYTCSCSIKTTPWIIKQTHNDKVAGLNDAHRKTQEDFFIKYFTSHLYF